MKGLELIRSFVTRTLSVFPLAALLLLVAGASGAAMHRDYGYGGGVRYHGGGGYHQGGGRSYGGGGYYGGGGSYCGGGHYYGGGFRYVQPYRYYPPRTFVSFGVRFGSPSYCYRPVYHYSDPVYTEPRHAYVEPRQQYVEPDRGYDDGAGQIDVENEPPAGCYYYDPFCDEQFRNLDLYTDHLQSHDHAQTIEIVQENSGHTLRTLEFVGGTWRVRN